MNTRIASTFFALVFTAGTAFAGANDYQVTGPVTALTDKVITVTKGGKEAFEINRDAKTKAVGSEVKVGDKVTVHYTMTATSIEDKGVAPAKKASAKKDKAASPAPAAAASPAKP